MKPNLLILKNIGPFLNETVDFTQLENMFLICGNTGAGKTFIFDAITFALYGKLKGNRANLETELRSKYAKEEEESYVDFSFEVGNQKYKIRRTVQTKYINKKGKESIKYSEVDICKFDGNEYIPLMNQTEPTNVLIKQIIGLEADEFAQVVLLPQGAFAEFLKESSTKRRETLGKLFPVTAFTSLMETIKKDSKDIEEELTIISRQIEFTTNKRDFSNAKEVLTTLETKIENLKNQENILIENKNKIASKKALLQKKIDEKNERIRNKKKYEELIIKKDFYAELSKKLDMAQKALELKIYLEQKRTSERTLEKAKSEYDICKSKLKEITIEYEKEKNNLENVNKMEEQLSLRKKIYSKIETKLNDSKNYIKLPIEQLNIIKNYENKKEIKEKDLIDFNFDSFDSINTNLNELFSKLEVAEKRDNTIKLIEEIETKNNKLKKELEELTETLQRNTLSLEELKKQEEQQKLNNMAFSVSKKLLKGIPCPVCGSLEHPNPAKENKNILNFDEQIRTFEQNIKFYTENVQNKKIELGANNSKLELLEKEKETFNSLETTEKIKESYEIQIHNYYYLIFVLQNLEILIKNHTAIIENFKINFSKTQENFTKENTKYSLCKKTMEDAIIENKKQIEILNKNIKQSIFNTEKEIEESLIESFIFEQKNNELHKYYEELKAIQAVVEISKQKETEEDIQNKFNKIQEDEHNTDIEFNTIKIDLSDLLDKYTNFSSDYKNIINLQEQYEKKVLEYKPYKLLCEDLNGLNPQKIQFDSWALGMYFEQVVNYASKRFFDISNGRFQFNINSSEKSGRGFKGLDLTVSDSFTGCERDPSTLSGGEIFEASISLALAITDVVQNQNGTIPLDSIFIDEGFGTLDSETLDKAMEILTELQETKMIGIISHVDSLQQVVPSIIEIEKTNCGSHIKIK